MKNFLKQAISGLSILLFAVSCSFGQPVQPTPTPPPAQVMQYEKLPPYAENIRKYKEINVNTWLDYNKGLPLRNETEILQGKRLTPESILAYRDEGSLIEYLELREDSGDVYWVTWNRTSDSISVISSQDVAKRLEENKSEIKSTVVEAIANNEIPIPEVSSLLGTDNPYAVERALQFATKDLIVADYTSGELLPFLDYKLQRIQNNPSVELTVYPEVLATYAALSSVGGDLDIPFASEAIDLFVAPKIARKIKEHPEATRLSFQIEYDEDGKIKLVKYGINESFLVRLGKGIYYMTDDRKEAEAISKDNLTIQEKFSNIVKDISEEEIKKEIEQAGEEIKERLREQVSDVQEELEEKAEKLKEGVQKKYEEIKKQQEEQRKRIEEEVEKIKENTGEIIDKGKEALCETLPILCK